MKRTERKKTNRWKRFYEFPLHYKFNNLIVKYRIMRHARLILLFIFLISFTFAASHVSITEPVVKDVTNNDFVDLGEIGPGQTIFVRIEPHVSDGGKFGQGGDYDLATPVNLPNGWKGNQSLLYQRPVLQVTITAAKDAPEGVYIANITVQDTNGDQLQDIKFAAKIKITWNVLQTDVYPKSVSVGPGQPARYEISVTNKGTASDVFEVSSTGLKRWQFKKYIYVPAKSTKKIVYELVENEEEFYKPVITVVSTASDLIKDEKEVDFEVQTDLKSDYKATNDGVIILPIFESIVYSFMGLISNLLG